MDYYRMHQILTFSAHSLESMVNYPPLYPGDFSLSCKASGARKLKYLDHILNFYTIMNIHFKYLFEETVVT